MTALTFDILRSAVNLAKSEQTRTVKRLKERLKDLYPQNDSEIDSALKAWAEYAAQ